MKNLIVSILILMSSSLLLATEFRVDSGQIKFVKACVVVNGNENFFWNKTKADNFYANAVAVGTNTVTENYPSPSDDEVNLSTCALSWNNYQEFKDAKKGYLNKKIHELQNNDDELDIIDIDSRIAWLKDYRKARR